MDRVRNLANYFADAANLNVFVVRDCIWGLFLVVDQECAKVELLAIYDLIMSNVLRQGENDLSDAFDGLALRKSVDVDKCAFAIFEAIDGCDHFDGAEFERIVTREVAAGRMRGDEPGQCLAVAAGELRIQKAARGHPFTGLGPAN